MRFDLRRYTRRLTTAALAWGCIIQTGAGCGGDLPTDPVKADSATLLAKLDLTYKAIVLSVHAPYDTVRLDAIARNLRGEALAHTGRLHFRRLNELDRSVDVDSTGLVRARATASSAKVIVSLTLDGVERTDTATIMVRNESPVQHVARIEFSPLPPDSAWRWAGNAAAAPNLTSWVRLYDADNVSIPTNRATFAFSTDDPDVHPLGTAASYLRNVYAQRRIGATWLRVKFYAYGTAFHDSVLFRRIEPPVKFVVIDRVVPANGPPSIVFYPSRLEIKPGMTVVFLNRPGTRPDVVTSDVKEFWGNRILRSADYGDYVHEWVDSTGIAFDAPPGPILAGDNYLNPASGEFSGNWPSDGGIGDIPRFAWTRCRRVNAANFTACGSGTSTVIIDSGNRSRKFTTPGTYRYSSSAFPEASGTIVVTPAP